MAGISLGIDPDNEGFVGVDDVEYLDENGVIIAQT